MSAVLSIIKMIVKCIHSTFFTSILALSPSAGRVSDSAATKMSGFLFVADQKLIYFPNNSAVFSSHFTQLQARYISSLCRHQQSAGIPEFHQHTVYT